MSTTSIRVAPSPAAMALHCQPLEIVFAPAMPCPSLQALHSVSYLPVRRAGSHRCTCGCTDVENIRSGMRSARCTRWEVRDERYGVGCERNTRCRWQDVQCKMLDV